jgi:hypothetical protein
VSEIEDSHNPLKVYFGRQVGLCSNCENHRKFKEYPLINIWTVKEFEFIHRRKINNKQNYLVWKQDYFLEIDLLCKK